MESYCKNCGAPLNPTSQFCEDCGAKVEKPKNNPYCHNCGCRLDDADMFCPECGEKVKESTCPNCGQILDVSQNFCEACGTNLQVPGVIKTNGFLEKYKIPLIIGATALIVVIIILAAISLVPIEEDVGTQTITVGSHSFEIPGDYVLDPSSIDVDYTGYNVVFSQGYVNSNNEQIYIGVMNIPYNVDSTAAASSQGGVQKDLMGVSGYYTEDSGLYGFAFADGAYVNVVGVSSPYILMK